ncbi:RISC-loading complex subunit tarbp2-like [Anneissia japonica]|uniref:RISC-loading complex subunit tarbp2-like n=1 Tax=Anneissia japonica TaxID=1529436 RepID=UPI001425888B|nr:RISC-loading complex subunit tarbp2-like [Anneissia japonica]
MTNCKTAVSVLQELCAKKAVTPVYETIGQEGASHQPTFTIRCTVGDVTGTGEGHSKKSAKQAAAEVVLRQLEVPIPVVAKQEGSQTSVDGTGTPDASNPVGELQELVTYLGWRKPEYEECEEKGPPHAKEFTISIQIGTFIEKGIAKSKRLAKRLAAAQMLTTIKSLPPDTDPGQTTKVSQDIRTLVEMKQKKGNANNAAIQAHKNQLNLLQTASGEKIEMLRSQDVMSHHDSNYCSMLQDLAEEQNFEIRYIPIEETSLTGRMQCLVQLNMAPGSGTPFAVCHGTADTLDQSKAEAALNALNFLKVLSKKGLPNSNQ